MRVLVVGSLPPPVDERAKSLLRAVADLADGGDVVETAALSPVAAAHRYLGAPGLVACARVARLAPRYDAVVVQFEPGLPVRKTAGQLERAACLLALFVALRRAHVLTLRLHGADDLPGGAGGRAAELLWRRADRVVAGSEVVAALLGATGVEPSVVDVEATVPEAPPDDGGWGEGADASAERVLALVRERAAHERQLLDRDEEHDEPLRVIGWAHLPAPGAGLLPDVPAGRPARAPGLGGLARAALAEADRHRYLRPISTGARAARRAAKSVAP